MPEPRDFGPRLKGRPRPPRRCARPVRLAAALLLLAGCSGAPEPREARFDRGLGERLGLAPTIVEGTFGAELTLAEIRARHVEPRCAEAGQVMTSLRVSRRSDGAQNVAARCGLPFAMMR